MSLLETFNRCLGKYTLRIFILEIFLILEIKPPKVIILVIFGFFTEMKRIITYFKSFVKG